MAVEAPEQMRIGELARRAGVTTRTVRHYEQLGLMSPNERASSGYRYYTERELVRLRKIDQLKDLGLSLEEIGQVIDLYFDDATGARGKRKVLEILRGHLHEARRRRESLQAPRGRARAQRRHGGAPTGPGRAVAGITAPQAALQRRSVEPGRPGRYSTRMVAQDAGGLRGAPAIHRVGAPR